MKLANVQNKNKQTNKSIITINSSHLQTAKRSTELQSSVSMKTQFVFQLYLDDVCS